MWTVVNCFFFLSLFVYDVCLCVGACYCKCIFTVVKWFGSELARSWARRSDRSFIRNHHLIAGGNTIGLRDTNWRLEDICQERRTKAANQMPPHSVDTTGCSVCLHNFSESPLAVKEVIQEEIKNGFAPIVSWTVSLIACLTLAEAAFSPAFVDRGITSLQTIG